MIAVFVTFDSDMLDEGVVRKVASAAKGTFEGMAGLRNKFFTLAENHNQATNVYVWDSERTAREFFSDQLGREPSAWSPPRDSPPSTAVRSRPHSTARRSTAVDGGESRGGDHAEGSRTS